MKKSYFLLALLLLTIAQPAMGAAPVLKEAAINDVQKTLKITVDEYSEVIPTATLDSWLSHKNSLYLSPEVQSEFENIYYCPASEIFCAITLTRIQRQNIRLASNISINSDAIKSYVEDLARRVNRDAADAKFKVENGVVGTFEEARNGLALNTAKSFEVLSEAISKDSSEVTLPFDSIKSNVNYSDINNMGISSLIGEGTSNFKGSPANRIHNIKVATERYNGLLIKPGEEFSFVKHLGEVDGEHGYLPELVIKKNKTEAEFGGGICQVSSTAFRAAIYSGLKITARRNHAYPVSYYNPQGMDATVYVPNPDMKFLNNTPGYILIQTKIEGTQLTFSFYGTNDGRTINIDGPRIIEKQPDGSLKATFTQNVITKDGTEIINDIFNSSYDSPYRYPHPGGPILTVKPANWSADEWKAYKKAAKIAQQ